VNPTARSRQARLGRHRGGGLSRLGVAVALLATSGTLAVVALRGPTAPNTLEDRVHAIGATLRCPVCRDLSVADSPSAVAREMRAAITRELQAGETPDEIRSGFVASYGESILLSPARRGINLVAWIAPLLFVMFGLSALLILLRGWARKGINAGFGRGPRSTEGPDIEELSQEDRRLLDRAISEGERTR
jgi:cytochrome c-type biogenesis protein CcmH